LVQPYGATNTELYTPFIKGKSLEWIVTHLSQINFSPEDSLKVYKGLKEKTLPLHEQVAVKLDEYLKAHGYVLDRKQDGLNRNDPDIYLDPETKSELDLLIDFHPGIMEDSSERYRQWRVPEQAIDQIKITNNPILATDILLANSVCVDPVYLFSPLRNYTIFSAPSTASIQP
jgi:hypothetical protein